MFLVLVVALDGVVGDGRGCCCRSWPRAVAAAGMVAARRPIDRLVRGVTHHRLTTPYSVLAQTTARVGAGSLEEALPGLAQVIAEGTGAQRAVVWLAVDDRLVETAAYPVDGLRRPPRTTSRCCSPGPTPTTWCRCSTARSCGPR